eukprot:CAMPEP_0206529716 /NCGR_PEP_ID=MMETSP0325_2-20121206/2753_1 /ASSEMBLY_ACC=CAM_ASM_000347 /TAXON_ID=2866 /ORGANISM="Crypthecodinium cohnii, Strain Seligo" /LENGTH=433 /DNA_ID=CAMNT_0054025657 /DNA_START=136 /DNA_END=1433 /DNA_ORIENTATION=-
MDFGASLSPMEGFGSPTAASGTAFSDPFGGAASGGGSGAFGDLTGFGSTDPVKPKKNKKKDKKDKDKSGMDPFGDMGGGDTSMAFDWVGGSGGGNGGASTSVGDIRTVTFETGLADPFADEVGSHGGRRKKTADPFDDPFAPTGALSDSNPDRSPTRQGSDPRKSFEAVIAADREVVQQLRREVDDIADIVRREQDEGRQLQRLAHEKQDETARLQQQEKTLLESLTAAKKKLQSVRETVRAELVTARQSAEARFQVAVGDHQNVNLAHLSLHNDLLQASQELALLQEKLDDDRRTCDHFHQANKLLQVHNAELDHQLEHLKIERKQLTEEVLKEKEGVKRDERELAELRNKVAQLRRSCLVEHHERLQKASKDEALAAMKGRDAAVRGAQPTRPHDHGGHSWSAHVFNPTGPQTSAPAKRGVPVGLQGPGAG